MCLGPSVKFHQNYENLKFIENLTTKITQDSISLAP
jgi:hypothetical protein